MVPVDTLKLLAAIALAALVHFVGMSLWPGFGRTVDVFLVVVVLHGLGGSSFSALVVGLIAGLLQDTLTSAPFGLFGFADTIVGYVTARLAPLVRGPAPRAYEPASHGLRRGTSSCRWSVSIETIWSAASAC